ncbi:hypothetical protein VNO78_17768 [Psophocarpus tetragonolobus]|uniref:Uncharacterized protein n=1 Tax=Psophocarpus tetragonolobus TaxID=3891 RepID=A0AAN9XL88_PSOTE
MQQPLLMMKEKKAETIPSLFGTTCITILAEALRKAPMEMETAEATFFFRIHNLEKKEEQRENQIMHHFRLVKASKGCPGPGPGDSSGSITYIMSSEKVAHRLIASTVNALWSTTPRYSVNKAGPWETGSEEALDRKLKSSCSSVPCCVCVPSLLSGL